MKKRKKALKPLRRVKRFVVNLESKKLKTIPVDKKLANATEVRLDYNSLRSIGEVQVCQNITILRITCNYIESLEGIENCKNLKYLFASSNNLETVEELKSLTKLKELHLDHNEITSVRPLKYLSHLRILNLNNNRLSGASYISKLRLHELHISSNKLTKLNINTNHMQTLDCSSNPLASLPELSDSPHLTSLYISDCKIIELSLPSLPSLVTLRTSHNKLTKFEVYSAVVPQLESLDLGQNRISDLNILIPVLSQHKELCTLYLAGNPLCHDTTYATNVLDQVRQLRMVDTKYQTNIDKNLKIDDSAQKMIKEYDLDLNLDIETLERQFLEKLKEEKKKIMKEKQRKSKNKSRSRYLEDESELEEFGKLITGPSKVLQKQFYSEQSQFKKNFIDQQKTDEEMERERLQEEEEMREVTRLYEECRKASDTVYTQIESIVSDFGGSFDEYKEKMVERQKKIASKKPKKTKKKEKSKEEEEEEGEEDSDVKELREGDVLTVSGQVDIRKVVSQRPSTARNRRKVKKKAKKSKVVKKKRPMSSNQQIKPKPKFMPTSSRKVKLKDIRRPELLRRKEEKNQKDLIEGSNQRLRESVEKVENDYTMLKRRLEQSEDGYGMFPVSSDKLFKKMNIDYKPPNRRKKRRRGRGRPLSSRKLE